MKKVIHLLPAMILIMANLSAFSQKYRTAADTVKLNKEYVKVSNDVAELTSKLTVAQNNLPGYNARADEANSDAHTTAIESSTQASKATSGNVKDAKKAKRKSKKALSNAKDARSASNKVEGQDKKIASLTSQLAKKQDRLKRLDEMRVAITNIQQ